MDETEIAPEMMMAGLAAYRAWDRRFEEPEDLVEAIIIAALECLERSTIAGAPADATTAYRP